jgi:hypothetical protein
MALVTDIVATYRGPGRVVDRLLSAPEHEGRALALLMGACIMVFISQWPVLARRAHLEDQDLQMLLGGSMMAWVFIAPLIFYVLAYIAYLVARVLGGTGSAYGARLALFWALLASSPLILLNGLVAGFIGQGPQLTVVGILWTLVFAWFWVAGMRRAGWGQR